MLRTCTKEQHGRLRGPLPLRLRRQRRRERLDGDEFGVLNMGLRASLMTVARVNDRKAK